MNRYGSSVGGNVAIDQYRNARGSTRHERTAFILDLQRVVVKKVELEVRVGVVKDAVERPRLAGQG